MKNFLVLIFCSFLFACKKDSFKPGSINGPVQNDNALTDRVSAVKNNGTWSDTCAIAIQGEAIVINGNSQVERMNYSNWKSTWINKGYHILNRAIGGTTWVDKIQYIYDLATVYHPSDIIAYDGENEYLRWTNTSDKNVSSTIIPNFNRSMDSLRRQNPDARIYVVSMLTCPVLAGRGFSDDIIKLNEEYKSRVARDSITYPGKIKFVDIRPFYQTNSGKFDPDGIHIKLIYYPDFYNALKAVLPKPGTVSPQMPPADTTTSPIDSITDTTISPAPAVKPVNILPVAKAGADISVPKSWNYSPVVNGTTSADPDGWIASFKWTFVSGPASYTIASPNSGKTKLDSLVAGIYVFRLNVTDNKGGKSYDDVTVTITNK